MSAAVSHIDAMIEEEAVPTWRGDDVERVRRCAVPDVFDDRQLAELALAMCRSRSPLALVTGEEDPIAARIVCVNEAFARRAGVDPEDIVNHSALLLAGLRPDPAYVQLLGPFHGDGVAHAKVTKLRRDGTSYAAVVRVIRARDTSGRVSHRLIVEDTR